MYFSFLDNVSLVCQNKRVINNCTEYHLKIGILSKKFYFHYKRPHISQNTSTSFVSIYSLSNFLVAIEEFDNELLNDSDDEDESLFPDGSENFAARQQNPKIHISQVCDNSHKENLLSKVSESNDNENNNENSNISHEDPEVKNSGNQDELEVEQLLNKMSKRLNKEITKEKPNHPNVSNEKDKQKVLRPRTLVVPCEGKILTFRKEDLITSSYTKILKPEATRHKIRRNFSKEYIEFCPIQRHLQQKTG